MSLTSLHLALSEGGGVAPKCKANDKKTIGLYGHFGVSLTSGAKFCHSTVVREVKIIIDYQIGKQRPMRHRVLMVSEGAYYVHI